MDVKLKENERIDDLEFKNLKIIQNKEGFCFGIDAVLLSDFAKNIKKDSQVLDLGTGTGIISILLCGKTKLKKITGVEVQKEVYDMACRSAKINNLENKFEVINENILNLENIFENNSFDAMRECLPVAYQTEFMVYLPVKQFIKYIAVFTALSSSP